MKKRFLALGLVLALCLALLPTAALAADNTRIPYAVTEGNIYFNADTGVIVGCDDTVTAAVIPEKINNVAVTGIQYYAFGKHTKLTSVTIPNSVTNISNCAFGRCSSLTGITVAEGNPSYCDVNGVLFSKDKKLLHTYPGAKDGAYQIPDGVTEIYDRAFFGCTKLTGVTIANSVSDIGHDAFFECDSLTNITIPTNVLKIGYAAFGRCSKLTDITVADGNPNYCSEDGVLFSKDKTLLHTYPCAKDGAYQIPDSVTKINTYAFSGCGELTGVITIPNRVTRIEDFTFDCCEKLTGIIIPDSVTSIGWCAFQGCNSLTDVTIPDSVQKIEPRTFEGCESLASVTIPTSVTGIGFNAFNVCPKLTDVYYTGTPEQWKAITVEADNKPLTNATIHYNSTGPIAAEGALGTADAEEFTWNVSKEGELTLVPAQDVTVAGGDAVLAAVWDKDGRFLGVKAIENFDQKTTVRLHPDWHTVKLIWLNAGAAPRCPAATGAKDPAQ